MAIYKDANGQWRDSNEAAYGDPGRVIAPPSWSGESAPAAPSPQAPTPAPTAPAPSSGYSPIQPGQVRTTKVDPIITQGQPGVVTQVQPVYTPATPESREEGIQLVPNRVTLPEPTTTQLKRVEATKEPLPDQTKDPAVKKRALVTSDGTAIEVPEIDYERIRQDLQRQHDEIVKQREFENELKTKESEQAALQAAADKAYKEALIAGQGADRAQRAAEAAMENERALREIKVSEMLAEGDRAYKQALIEGQNADRAQKASEIAMENNYRQQLLYVQQQLQGQKLAIEQRSAQQERRRNRPFAPRPTVTAA